MIKKKKNNRAHLPNSCRLYVRKKSFNDQNMPTDENNFNEIDFDNHTPEALFKKLSPESVFQD